MTAKQTVAAGALLVALFIAPAARSSPAAHAAQTAPDRPPFSEWLDALRTEALAAGISAETVDAALATVEAPEEEVVERDRSQPERVRTLEDYVGGWLTPRTVSRARAVADRHASLLQQVSDRYGVPSPVMVAVWGLESNFGRFTGTDPTVAALATLAYDPRRSDLFRRELFQALRILDAGHITLDGMKGSWAGAMGQPQFMPSSYLEHAVDFNEDGRADIWHTEADVLASMANYLKAAGWVEGERWGREVRVGADVLARIDAEVPRRRSGCAAVRQLTVARPLAEWDTLGVRLAGGAPLPTSDMTASLVRGSRRYFLVYRNYHALLDYNCSNSYAISIGLLSDRLW
jgi:membrane-bound lytic murein transglycosylase B